MSEKAHRLSKDDGREASRRDSGYFDPVTGNQADILAEANVDADASFQDEYVGLGGTDERHRCRDADGQGLSRLGVAQRCDLADMGQWRGYVLRGKFAYIERNEGCVLIYLSLLRPDLRPKNAKCP